MLVYDNIKTGIVTQNKTSLIFLAFTLQGLTFNHIQKFSLLLAMRNR